LLKAIASGILIVAVSGCASIFYEESESAQNDTMEHDEVHNLYAHQQGFVYQPDSYDYWRDSQTIDQHRAQSVFVHKRLADYADQLAMQLIESAYSLTQSDKITVASFVRLDTSLREPTLIGNRITEALMLELQHYGLSVIDTKLTTDYAITARGDLALARDGYLLKSELDVDYILTGTMIDRANGVEVNARIIGVAENRLAASASVFIPGIIVANESQLGTAY
jgi:TolB-like protein